MFYLIIIFYSCSQKEHSRSEVQAQITTNNIEESTIKEACTNVVVTDSLLFLWDKITYNFLINKFEETYDSCFFNASFNFIDRNLLRLEFLKTLNNKELISHSDLTNPYFIIEYETKGYSRNFHKYLIKYKNKRKLTGYHFFLKRTDYGWIWEVNEQLTIKKEDLKYLISLLQKDSRNIIANYSYNTDVFSLYEFHTDSIIGYMSFCNVKDDIITFYNKIIKKSFD